MKTFIRFLKILLLSAIIAGAGAWSILYYLGQRVGESGKLEALGREPLIVIAAAWFVANLLLVFLLRKTPTRDDDKQSQGVSPMLSEAAIARLHAESLKHKDQDENKINESIHVDIVPAAPGKKTTANSDGSEGDVTSSTHSEKKKAPKATVHDSQNSDQNSTGIIKWFNGQKGYGFITSEAGEEVFVHCRSIRPGGKRQLHTGQQVSFTLVREDKGLKAEDVQIIE